MKTQSPSGLSLKKIIFILILVVVYAGLAVWMIIPAPPTGFSWDDAWYQLMSEWLSADSDYRVFAWAMLRVTSYPPLFPLFMSWSGASLVDPQNAFILNAVFLAIGAGVAMYWFAHEGFSPVSMTFAGILVAFNPVSLGYLPILYSEFLFILLSTIALVIAITAREWRWNSKWVVLGVIVGLCVATRTAGWPLVAGIVLHLVLGRRIRPIVTFSLGFGAGILVIPFYMVGLPPSEGYVGLLIENMSSFGWGFVLQQVRGMVAGWVMLWGWGAGAWLAAIMVLPGLFIRLRANRVDAWYVMLYFGMLLVSPWPGHMGRYLWPLLPCLLVSAHSSFAFIRNSKHRSFIPGVLLGLILISSIPDGIARSLQRLMDPPKDELFLLSRMHEWTRSSSREEGLIKLRERRHLLNDLQRIGGIVEPEACIVSEMSALIAVQTQRVSYPVPWISLDEAGQSRTTCQYYYMIPDSLPGRNIDNVNQFSGKHEELFRSFMPGDTEGKLPMGVFLRFRPADVQ